MPCAETLGLAMFGCCGEATEPVPNCGGWFFGAETHVITVNPNLYDLTGDPAHLEDIVAVDPAKFYMYVATAQGDVQHRDDSVCEFVVLPVFLGRVGGGVDGAACGGPIGVAWSGAVTGIAGGVECYICPEGYIWKRLGASFELRINTLTFCTAGWGEVRVTLREVFQVP